MNVEECARFKSEIKQQLMILPNSPNSKRMHNDMKRARTYHKEHDQIIRQTLHEVNLRLLHNKETFVAKETTAVSMAM
jgi:hypothetical protein